MLDREPEQPALVGRGHAGGRDRDRDALNGNHLPHDPRGGVDGGHQDGTEAQCVRRDDLEIAEQRIRRRVASRQEHAHPADDRAEERKGPSGCRQRQPQRRRHAGIVHQLGEPQHQRNREDGKRELSECCDINVHELRGTNPQEQGSDHRGYQARGPGRGQPVEGEHRRVWRRLSGHRRNSRDQVVQTGDVQSVQHSGIPRQPCRQQSVRPAIEAALDCRFPPRQDNDDEQQVRQPRREDFAAGMHLPPRDRIMVALEAHDPRRPPQLQHGNHHDDAGERAHDVGQFGADVVRDEELHASKRHAAGDNRWQHFERARGTCHDDKQVPGNEHRYQGTQPADHRAQRQHRQPGHVGERDHRNSNRPERDGRGVGEEADARSVEWVKAEPSQHRS